MYIIIALTDRYVCRLLLMKIIIIWRVRSLCGIEY